MPLPPENSPEALVEFYSKLLAITSEIKSVTNSRTFVFEQGDSVFNNLQETNSNNAYVKIEFKDEKEPLQLILKRKPSNRAEHKGFAKEVFFYSVFFPDAIAFTEKRDEYKDVDFERLFPKCFHADADIILLENVLSKGFVMTPITRPHTFYQAEKVFENLGTFHAVARAMIMELGSVDFEKKYPLIAEDAVFLPEMAEKETKHWEHVLKTALAVLKCKEVDGSPEATSFLQKYQGEIFAELCQQVKSVDEDLLTTVNLGDVWSKNIFVQRDEEKRRYPAALFIDMKSTRIGSPMLDVGSYMFCVADHIHLTNWRFLFDVYFEFISKVSKAVGVDFQWQFDDLKVLYIGKSIHALFRALDHLMKRICLLVPELKQENFDFPAFEKWLAENPEANETLSVEIVAKVQQYEQYLLLLAE